MNLVTVFFIVTIFGLVKSTFHPFRSERYLSKQISSILNELFLSGYDRRIRPHISGPPLEVEVNIAVRSMGPVDELSQTFTLDCYFRQFWTDDRLTFNGTASQLDELSMNWAFLNKIWRPDTFIFNGKESYLHKMTVPNRFIRISPMGRISYSQRLTLNSRCQMDLHKFPLDSQTCPLQIGSFGHDAHDIIYKWSKVPAKLDEFEIAQYDLVTWRPYTKLGRIGEGRNRFNKSVVAIDFTFQRQTGFFLLQIYVPLTLIVCSSWVTFWLVKTEKGTEIPARTSLGATTVLSVVTIGFGGKGKPQVGYSTALDIFIILCFVTVFAALVEFAILNFIDTIMRRLKKQDREKQKVAFLLNQAQNQFYVQDNESYAGNAENGHHHDPNRMNRLESVVDNDAILEDENFLSPEVTPTKDFQQWETIETMVVNNGNEAYIPTEPETIALSDIVEIHTTWTDRCLDSIGTMISCCACSKKPVRAMEIYTHTAMVLNRVDKKARLYFPLVFISMNILYWTAYIYIL